MVTILESGFRDDLVEAHRGILTMVSRPGTWWTGAERTAIAAEVRRAREHADLPPWEAPSRIEGMVGDDHPLPPAAVDAVWRITNHPGTLTADWYEGIVADLPTAEHYVELVGIVAPMNAVDAFARVMDLDEIPLAEPADGEPTRLPVEGAEVSSHWVPTAPIKGPNVLKALSAVPGDRPAFQAMSDAQYVPADALLGDLEWGREHLDRRQIELVAAQTSMVNECFY